MKSTLFIFLLTLLAAKVAYADFDSIYFVPAGDAYGPTESGYAEDYCDVDGTIGSSPEQVAKGHIASNNAVTGACWGICRNPQTFVSATETSYIVTSSCDGGNSSNSIKKIPNPKQPPGECPIEGNSCSPATGGKTLKEIDIPSNNGLGVEFVRYYNSYSLPITTVRFGQLWRHNYDRTITHLNANSDPRNIGRINIYRQNGQVLTFNYVSASDQWIADADINSRLLQLTDSVGKLTGWRYISENDETELYGLSGKLLSITNRSGFTQQLTYDTNDQLISVTDAFGRTLSFNYDDSGRINAVTDPQGNVFQYSYGANNNLTVVTFPDATPSIESDNPKKIYSYENSSFANALTSVDDENNSRFATYSYDSVGRAILSKHGINAKQVNLTFNSDGTTTVIDSLGDNRVYSFTKILGVVKSAGSTHSCVGCGATYSAMSYDANGNIASKTDFNGNVTNYVYDLSRNLETSRTEAYSTALARTITTQWHSTYRLPILVSEPGKTTAFNYDSAGNLLSKTITDTALNTSRTWSWTYNNVGQVLTANGPRTDVSDVTTYTYYAAASTTAGSVHSIGDLATVTNALGHVTSITHYDLNGRPLTLVDPNNVVTTLEYGPRGWLKKRTVNNAQTTSYDYDGVGQLTQVTLPDNSALKYSYDTAHRLTDIEEGFVAGGVLTVSGNKIHYTLDAMGNRIQEDTHDPSNSILKKRARVFDALNRLQQDIGGTSPSTQITQYSYDNNGNLKTITDPLNHITTNGYDALNRLITVTDPANGVSSTHYNARDQVTSVADPRSVTTNYTIDALGDVSLTQSPDSGNTTNVYDAAGNLLQTTDARGVVANYSYDALNRLTEIDYPSDPSAYRNFVYGTVTSQYRKGRLSTLLYGNNAHQMTFGYDAYGNLKAQTDWITLPNSSSYKQFSSNYLYDNANRLKQISYPSGRLVTYTRTPLGRISQVQTQDSAGAAVQTVIASTAYEPFGPIKTLAFGNGVTTAIQHDADYQVARITTTSTPGWDYGYGYDAAGNILSQTDQLGTASKTFGYDALQRVMSDSTYAYYYDENGNRTQGGLPFFPYAQHYAASSNRLTKLSATPMPSDAAGNLQKDSGGGTLAYNAANQLAQWSKNGTTVTYQYNGFGWRNGKQQTASLTHYDYLPDGKLLAQTKFNSDNSYHEIVEYLWLDDMPIAQIKTSYGTNNAVSARRLTYIHADHLNTPRLMTDSTKTVVWKWHSDAYGMIGPNDNPDGDGVVDKLDLRFAGQIYDQESGLFYNLNRYYDPLIGRYTQSDPIGLRGGLNTYAYVDGNPVSYVDPLGLMGNGPGGGNGYTPPPAPKPSQSSCECQGGWQNKNTIIIGPFEGSYSTSGSWYAGLRVPGLAYQNTTEYSEKCGGMAGPTMKASGGVGWGLGLSGSVGISIGDGTTGGGVQGSGGVQGRAGSNASGNGIWGIAPPSPGLGWTGHQ